MHFGTILTLLYICIPRFAKSGTSQLAALAYFGLTAITAEEKTHAAIGLARVDMSVCLLGDDHECGLCATVCPVEAIKPALPADEQMVLTAVKAGASGFLLTSSPAAGIPAAIRAVAAGESHIDPGVTRMLFEHLRQPAEPDPMAFLSRTERELLEHLSEGLSNREIAGRMYLSEKTVKNYVSRLLKKLDMSRRAEAIAFSAALAERRRPSSPPPWATDGVPRPVFGHRTAV